MTLLDELVPTFEGEPADWDDVLRRARRRPPRRRLVLAAVGAVAALAAASAVAVPLLRSTGPDLPPEADRSNVALVVDHGRVVLKVAPWKGHAGVCYLVVGRAAGCVPATRRGPYTLGMRFPPNQDSVWTFAFDRRIVGAGVTLADGTKLRLPAHRFGARLYHFTFFGPVEIHKPVRAVSFVRARR